MKNQRSSESIYEKMCEEMNFARQEGDNSILINSLEENQEQLCVIIANCDDIIKNDKDRFF